MFTQTLKMKEKWLSYMCTYLSTKIELYLTLLFTKQKMLTSQYGINQKTQGPQ